VKASHGVVLKRPAIGNWIRKKDDKCSPVAKKSRAMLKAWCGSPKNAERPQTLPVTRPAQRERPSLHTRPGRLEGPVQGGRSGRVDLERTT